MSHLVQTKGSCFTIVISTLRMSHIFSESALMDSCEGVFLWLRLLKLWKDAMPRHMEDTMEHSGHMLKFGEVAFSGQQCMKIQRTLSGDAIDVKNMGISTHEMKCLSSSRSFRCMGC